MFTGIVEEMGQVEGIQRGSLIGVQWHPERLRGSFAKRGAALI